MFGRADQFLDLSAGKRPRESLCASTGFEESWSHAIDRTSEVQKIEERSQCTKLVGNVIVPPTVGKSPRQVVADIHRRD